VSRELTPDELRRRKDGFPVTPVELRPAGELSLNIQHAYGRSSASDSANQHVEDRINVFIEALLKEAFRQMEFRAEREREQLKRQEAERRRKEQLKEHRKAEARIEQFNTLVAYWRKTQERRAFLNRGRSLKLYFSANNHEIRRIKAEGFEDPEPSEYDQNKTPPGILLRDRRPTAECLADWIDVEVSEDLVLPYEVTEPGYVPRTFYVPACVLNQHLTKAPNDD
jgi:hypothetical protein